MPKKLVIVHTSPSVCEGRVDLINLTASAQSHSRACFVAVNHSLVMLSVASKENPQTCTQEEERADKFDIEPLPQRILFDRRLRISAAYWPPCPSVH